VRLAVKMPGSIQFSIFDVAGRRVAARDEGWVDAGSYSIRWDGRDASGAFVVDGVYFARITTAGNTSTYKLIKLSE
jgi:flagellar hook assembly protein FlgD